MLTEQLYKDADLLKQLSPQTQAVIYYSFQKYFELLDVMIQAGNNSSLLTPQHIAAYAHIQSDVLALTELGLNGGENLNLLNYFGK